MTVTHLKLSLSCSYSCTIAHCIIVLNVRHMHMNADMYWLYTMSHYTQLRKLKYNVSCMFFKRKLPYSLNFSRVKIFADFEVLSQTMKIIALKYLFKHTFSLRNALNPRKFYSRIRKSGWAAKIFTLKKFRLYGIVYFKS